jgi:hypothetical protein
VLDVRRFGKREGMRITGKTYGSGVFYERVRLHYYRRKAWTVYVFYLPLNAQW